VKRPNVSGGYFEAEDTEPATSRIVRVVTEGKPEARNVTLVEVLAMSPNASEGTISHADLKQRPKRMDWMLWSCLQARGESLDRT
jgi:hypothetical protein